jgi:hypothetical protein
MWPIVTGNLAGTTDGKDFAHFD